MKNLNEAQVERLIRISKEKPLLPETFVPWADFPTAETIFLPEKLISLYGDSLFDTLTAEQKKELGRLEVIQVMYSYGWSEGLACLFFNRHLLTIDPQSAEARFLIRELIEEFRHQEMFTMAVKAMDGTPIPPTGWHKFLGLVTAKYLPSSLVFMSVLAIEHMADSYAKHLRKDERVYSVLRKCSELHHIEEGRHIFYTEMWLNKFTEKANFFMRTIFSLVMMTNIYFMRTLYVKRSFFERLGVVDADIYYKAARKRFKTNLADNCLAESVEFVRGFNGFNFITRPLWRSILGVNI